MSRHIELFELIKNALSYPPLPKEIVQAGGTFGVTPKGYTRIGVKVTPKAGAIASRINKESRPYNYVEKFTDIVNGEEVHYLAKVEAHFDNHPIKDPAERAKTPPYWHKGVSVMRLIPGEDPLKDIPSSDSFTVKSTSPGAATPSKKDESVPSLKEKSVPQVSSFFPDKKEDITPRQLNQLQELLKSFAQTNFNKKSVASRIKKLITKLN